METPGIVTSHVWEPLEDPVERLADRAGDVGVGVQDKRFARAMALVKLPRGRGGDALPTAVLAHEKLAADIGRAAGVSVNEVYLSKLGSEWQDAGAEGLWASLHCLVPEPFQRLDELPAGQDILSGQDRTTLANDDELRAIRLFDAFIINGDRHAGNVLVSGAGGELRAYFIDHGYAFGGVVDPAQLEGDTDTDSKLEQYIRDRSGLEALLGGLSADDRNLMVPLARRLVDLEGSFDELVSHLPDEVASAPTKRFLLGVLRQHVHILMNFLK